MTIEGSALDTIGKRICAGMKRYGISMRALANKLCITQPTVFKWCHDQTLPRLDQIDEIAKILEVSPVWLAYGMKAPNEEGAALRLNSAVLEGALVGISKNNKPGPDDYLLFSVISDDMKPTLFPGDTVVVNKRIRRVEQSGIYLVNAPGGSLIRRFRRKLDGTLLVSCDNTEKYPESETLSHEAAIDVVGRVVSKVSVVLIS